MLRRAVFAHLFLACIATFGLALEPQLPGAATSPGTADVSTVALHDGQEIVLRNIDPISSNHSKPGDLVQFEVIRAVTSDDLVVIPVHAIAVGKVVSVEHANFAHHGGKLAIEIKSVQLTNGDYARLRAVESRKERNFSWQDVGAAALVAATIYYMPLAPVYLVAKGEDVKISSGTRFTAYVDGDVKVDRPSLEAVVTLPENHLDVATIVVFRGNHDRQPDFEQPVSCGRVLLGRLSGTTYVQFAVMPGKYWVYAFVPDVKLNSTQQSTVMVALNAEAGKTYYLELALVRAKWGVNGPTLQFADQATGEEAIFNAVSGAQLPPTQTLNNPQLSARPKGVKTN